ncbi:TetR/AcrR family transcriptional regulator [Actinophytocola xanthii]|uniref:Uncharacterized protein n=1 Tax=Actinophytocola xanthii TaxID=1912961 RepID=A0A1Q8CTG8_9PSEU|nr:TetR/AcrR family transcriptional regulator [Actinophytocola xanthii]OLF17651.1 hypothetical protein BU204_10570 [Actinophytocola xanthii]
MARPPDLGRRAATLAMATDYVLAQGLAGLSLRPLAAALDTSTRMLLYDFSSKEGLVSAILSEARQRLGHQLAGYVAEANVSPADMLPALWSWMTSAENSAYLRLFFEVHVDALTRPEVYTDGGRPLVGDWLNFLRATLRLDPATATLIVATMRGLLLDRMLTHDEARTDLALARFADLLHRDTGEDG